jgi:hypothetical protein
VGTQAHSNIVHSLIRKHDYGNITIQKQSVAWSANMIMGTQPHRNTVCS